MTQGGRSSFLAVVLLALLPSCTNAGIAVLPGIAADAAAPPDSPRVPPPDARLALDAPSASCRESTEGELRCVVCESPLGTVVEKRCDLSAPLEDLVTCRRQDDPSARLACVVCADARGPRSEDCPASRDAPRPFVCAASSKDGLPCQTCRDATGAEALRECGRPGASVPAHEAWCTDEAEGDLPCSVCRLDGGRVVSKRCASGG